MNIRLILVALIVLAQLGWLGADYIYRSMELANAPRILVNASLTPLGGGYFWPTRMTLEPETPLLGKSIWWSMQSVQHRRDSDVCIPITPRENPGDEMPGALELRLQFHGNVQLFRNGICLQGEEAYLSAIWSKGDNGLWNFRLVAPNSPEDVLADGELRTKAVITSWDGDEKNNLITFSLQPFKQKHTFLSVHYELNDDMARAFQEWTQKDQTNTTHSNRFDRLQATMEIALRKDMSPKVTQLYYNGIPAAEAIRLMKQDAFPLPAEMPKEAENVPPPVEETQTP